MRLAFAALALATAAITLPALAQMPTTAPGAPDPARVKGGSYSVDPHHTQILFKVNHLGFNSYYGIFGGAKGSLKLDRAKPAASAVSIEIPVALVLTTSSELNTHLKAPDFFDTAKFPTATFKSTSVAVQGTKAKITGNLTLRGVTKPVTLDAWFTGAGPAPMSKADTIGFEATTTLKRSDFGISYGVPLVADEVPLKITVAFEKKG
jgi:polyisoprenoid-binding protein YceI